MLTKVTSMFFLVKNEQITKWKVKMSEAIKRYKIIIKGTFSNHYVNSIFRRADFPQFAFIPMFAPQHNTWLIYMTI